MACQIVNLLPNDGYDPPSWNLTALSIKQPFARFIGIGTKTIEVRSRRTNYRGRFVVCASATVHPGQYLARWTKPEMCVWPVIGPDFGPFYDAGVLAQGWPLLYPLGVTICSIRLADCRPMVPTDQHAARVAYRPGLWSWILEAPREVPQIPVKGRLGFYSLDLKELLKGTSFSPYDFL